MRKGARKGRRRSTDGFTLIELIVVITVIALTAFLAGSRLGTFTFWREEAFVNRLAEVLQFLHTQAVLDQAFYRIEFDFETNSYRVGILRPESDVNTGLAQTAADVVGTLTLELADYLNPSIGDSQTLIAPPSFPSLAERQPLPSGTRFKDIRSSRGVTTATEGGTTHLLFSPRGFSEFGVIHLELSSGQPITLLINPFTGEVEIFREYKDFQWTYGRQGAAR